MKEEIREAIKEWLQDNEESRLSICRDINSYNGSMDFANTYDFEELASITNDVYEFGRSIIYGDVTNIGDPVRYNAYGNLESVNEYELIKESEDYIEEILYFIDEEGFSYLDCDELEELYNKLENEEENEEE